MIYSLIVIYVKHGNITGMQVTIRLGVNYIEKFSNTNTNTYFKNMKYEVQIQILISGIYFKYKYKYL